jgi:hypothetical protein
MHAQTTDATARIRSEGIRMNSDDAPTRPSAALACASHRSTSTPWSRCHPRTPPCESPPRTHMGGGTRTHSAERSTEWPALTHVQRVHSKPPIRAVRRSDATLRGNARDGICVPRIPFVDTVCTATAAASLWRYQHQRRWFAPRCRRIPFPASTQRKWSAPSCEAHAHGQ